MGLGVACFAARIYIARVTEVDLRGVPVLDTESGRMDLRNREG